MTNFARGDRVRVVPDANKHYGHYVPVGTLGTVTAVSGSAAGPVVTVRFDGPLTSTNVPSGVHPDGLQQDVHPDDIELLVDGARWLLEPADVYGSIYLTDLNVAGAEPKLIDGPVTLDIVLRLINKEA